MISFGRTRLAVRQASEHTSTKMAVNKLQSRLNEIDTMYGFFKEERSYFRNRKFVKARKLVIYRQMLLTSKKAMSCSFVYTNMKMSLESYQVNFK